MLFSGMMGAAVDVDFAPFESADLEGERWEKTRAPVMSVAATRTKATNSVRGLVFDPKSGTENFFGLRDLNFSGSSGLPSSPV